MSSSAPSVLTSLAPGVWGATYDLRWPGGVYIPCRMTVLRLADGGLVLHSPIPIDEHLGAAIDTLGPVRMLIGPNRYHHLYLRAAQERFPTATLLGAPGLPAKRRGLRFSAELGDAPVPGLHGELDHLLVEGAPSSSEVVFLHRPSRTLVVTDLVFNIRACRGWSSRLVHRAVGTYGRLAPSRTWWVLLKDRAAFERSVGRVLAWDFDRIVMAHGEVVTERAHDALREAFLRNRVTRGAVAPAPA